MQVIGQNHEQLVCFVQFARWRHQSVVKQRDRHTWRDTGPQHIYCAGRALRGVTTGSAIAEGPHDALC